MQDDDQRGPGLQPVRNERKHLQIARIGAETGDFGERAAAAGPQIPGEISSEPVESGQFVQTPKEFDILGEGHRQLLGRGSFNSALTR